MTKDSIMNLFERLLSITQSKKEDPNLKIRQLFRYNLKNIQIDDGFFKIKEETVERKEETFHVETYQMDLEYKECNLFSKVELKKKYPFVNGKPSTESRKIDAITFCSVNLVDINVDDLEDFINNLYDYYGGLDSTKEGPFTEDDRRDFQKLNSFFGRMWSCLHYSNKYSIRVFIKNNRLEAEINSGFSEF